MIPKSASSFLSSFSVIFLLVLCAMVLSSCSSNTFTPVATLTASPLPTTTNPPPTSTPVPTPTPLSPDPPFLTWIDAIHPQQIHRSIKHSEFLSLETNKSSAQLLISQDPGPEAISWLYVAVTPFYSHINDILFSDIQVCWTNSGLESMPFKRIMVSPDTLDSLEFLWGLASEDCVAEIQADELANQLWLDQEAIGLIPFDRIQPDFKILSVDQSDPLSKDFARSEYSLNLRFNYQISPGYQIDLSSYPLITNYDPSKLSSIALTGVTALVRDTAQIMETEGVLYPAADIQNILSIADITHINNEVPFASDCPDPETYQVSLRFCSADRYIELLEVVGTDIVELSGDHFGDWGPEAMIHTINLYTDKGWAIYGGGATLSEGLAPVILTHNENRFAFIGCNGKGIDRYATATEEYPGASQCDFKWMIPEITRLTNEGYLVIATMQHEEVDSFGSIALQQYDFRRLAEAGAVVVSGSQSHHPQAFELTDSSFIHYGLGNLFFDQWFLAHYNPKSHINKDKSFIDMHYFYRGSYIGTRFVPLQFIDNARPRPMTLEERIPFLNEVYRYSLWNGEWVYLYSTGYMQDRIDQ